MKRSDLFIRLTTAALFLAVLCYIGVYIYRAAVNTYVTTVAFSYSLEETFPAHGYIIRSETVIKDSGDTVLPVVGEGEKVASGQAVAVEYLTSTALETAGEIRSLRLRIANLEATGSVAESARQGSVLALSKAINSGNLRQLDELMINVEACIFTGSVAPSELPALKARLDALERRNEGIRTLYAPVSGVFSQIIDGYEQVSPQSLVNITPARLTGLFDNRSRTSGAGKLVTEFKWYYATIMDAGDALRLPVGERITVQFSGVFNTSVQMLVESVSRRDGSLCAVLFSSDTGVHDIVQLRELSADIVYNTVSGIRIPKEAIQIDEDKTTFVYLQTGVRAERVPVEILRETGDSYLVRDGLETGSPLRAGAIIIVKANDLFDGKIVA